MPNTIRVLLRPRPQPSLSTRNPVLGVSLSLELSGAGQTSGVLDSLVPATLTFHGSFFRRILSGEAPTEKIIAILSGQILLRGAARLPVFIADVDALGRVTFTGAADIDDAAEPPQRVLRFEFETAHFQTAQFASLNAGNLVLPPEASKGFQHLEVRVELALAGAVEAAKEVNDVLDVPLTRSAPQEAPSFELQLVDEVGEPIADTALEIAHDDAIDQKTSDAQGLAFVRVVDPGRAIGRLKDLDTLKQTLKARWDTARGKPALPAGPALEVVELAFAGKDYDLNTEIRKVVSVAPRVAQVFPLGILFETAKAFVLPTVVRAFQNIGPIYDQNRNSQLLIVGHSSTAGATAFNDKLSLERADALAAYIEDDVDKWLEFYHLQDDQKRWGDHEDRLMLSSLPDSATLLSAPDPMKAFQQDRGLKVDGVAGSETRRQLILDYMAVDSAVPPDDIQLTTHGCGEHFPLTADGSELDSPAPDNQDDAEDRRVELFFFDSELGIQPPPPAKNSKAGSVEYPEWRLRALRTHTLEADAPPVRYNVVLLDEQSQPLAGIGLRFDLDGETQVALTGADGSALCFGKATATATVRLQVVDQLSSRLTADDPLFANAALPSTPTGAVLATPAQLAEGVPARAGGSVTIAIVAQLRLLHGGFSTGWTNLELGSTGPFTLDQTQLTRVGILENGTGKPVIVQLTPPSNSSEPLGVARWLELDPRPLHASLLAADFNGVFDVLTRIPLNVPLDSTDDVPPADIDPLGPDPAVLPEPVTGFA